MLSEGLNSGTKKEPKPKLLSLDIFWWGGGLPREGVGAKKFDMSLQTRETNFFLGPYKPCLANRVWSTPLPCSPDTSAGHCLSGRKKGT